MKISAEHTNSSSAGRTVLVAKVDTTDSVASLIMVMTPSAATYSTIPSVQIRSLATSRELKSCRSSQSLITLRQFQRLLTQSPFYQYSVPQRFWRLYHSWPPLHTACCRMAPRQVQCLCSASATDRGGTKLISPLTSNKEPPRYTLTTHGVVGTQRPPTAVMRGVRHSTLSEELVGSAEMPYSNEEPANTATDCIRIGAACDLNTTLSSAKCSSCA